MKAKGGNLLLILLALFLVHGLSGCATGHQIKTQNTQLTLKDKREEIEALGEEIRIPGASLLRLQTDLAAGDQTKRLGMTWNTAKGYSIEDQIHDADKQIQILAAVKRKLIMEAQRLRNEFSVYDPCLLDVEEPK